MMAKTKKHIDKGADFDAVLPAPPTLTPSQLEINNAERAKLAENFTARFAPDSRAFDRANAVIKETKVLLDDNYPLDIFQRAHYQTALETVGRYDEAALYGNKEENLAIWSALNQTIPACKCPDFETVVLEGQQSKKVKYTRFFVKRSIFSVIDGTTKDLVLCNQCKEMFVR